MFGPPASKRPTPSGNVRYVARDSDGNEYTTFREDIGARARQLQGRRVRLEYHEEQRGRYTNVYLDKIEPTGPTGLSRDNDTDPQEAAWQTAVMAAPWLVGQPGRSIPPEELYDKLKPFEGQVATDIEEKQHERNKHQDK